MTHKSKKALNIAVNVIVSIIVILVLILTINILASSKKGYVNLFGYTQVAVRSDSMKGDKSDNFQKGDLLKVKILSESEKKELKEGDVITFYQKATSVNSGENYITIDGDPYFINSHRIVRINGEKIYTQGDNTNAQDPSFRDYSKVIGKVVSHTDGLGYVTMWFQSQTGFFVCVVLPSLLVVVYCIYNLVKVILERNKEVAGNKEEELKQQLLAQLRAEGKLVESAATPAEPVLKESEAVPAPLPKESEPVAEALPVSEPKESETPSAEPETKPAAAKKAPAKKKQPIILSAESETEAEPKKNEEPSEKPATAKKAPAKKKQPIILSAEPEAESAEAAKPKSVPKTKKSSGAGKPSDGEK